MFNTQRLSLLTLLAVSLSACVVAASRPIELDGSAVSDAPPPALVRLLNDANAQPKGDLGFMSDIPCKDFTETHTTIRNHQTGSVSEVPYSSLTFMVVSNHAIKVAQVTKQGSIGMNCSILVFPPSASGDFSPEEMEAISNVGVALRGLGANLAPGITVR